MPAGPLGLGQRWTVARKREVVLRLLRDEPVQLLSRQLGVEIFRPSSDLWFEFSLPNKRRKQAEDFHRRKDGFVLSSHSYGPGLFPICVPER